MLRRRFEIALVRLDEGQEFFDRPPNLADQSMDAVYRQSPRTVICACLGVPSVAMQRARRTIWLRSARPETRKCQRQIRAQAGHGLALASGKIVWEYEAASPVTASPAVAKGKVVVATADGQVICFG